LYKQATAGDAPQEKTYGMFDFVAKAKHEAWQGLNGLSKEAAMQQYIDLVAVLQKR
jgi:acyl-CoA-binding protein